MLSIISNCKIVLLVFTDHRYLAGSYIIKKINDHFSFHYLKINRLIINLSLLC